MPLPPRAHLCDVGPRDGFQFEETFIPTDLKRAVIGTLVEAGLRRIQVTSFVHPKWVPQMADAEDLCALLLDEGGAPEGVTYTGLALNPRGLERLHAAGLKVADLSIATHDEHSRANANMTVAEATEQGSAMMRYAAAHGLTAQMNLQTVFGYRQPGDTPVAQVVEMAQHFAGLGAESVALSDSTGMANPQMIRDHVEAVRPVLGDAELVLHLHDTRGLGLANVHAALEMGVTRFDTSLAGMGGCPFIEGATGNIATEDTAYLCDQLGVATGIDGRRVAEASARVEAFLGTAFPGKLHRLYQREAAQAPA